MRSEAVRPAFLDVTFGGETLSGEYYAVNVACLDDATTGSSREAPVRMSGRTITESRAEIRTYEARARVPAFQHNK
jgi:hypothetical protein